MKKRIALILVIILCLVTFSGCGILDLIGVNGNNVDKKADKLLSSVYGYIKNNFADTLTDEELEKVILAGGNAMVGLYDDYGYLLSPKQYHDIMYPTASTATNIYGFTYTQLKYIGLKVSSIVTDSNVYDKLNVNDIIKQIKTVEGKDITFINDKGETVKLNVRTNDLNDIQKAIANLDSVQITVIHGGTEENCYEDGIVSTFDISRAEINNSNAKGFEFVEYYFGKTNNNVSNATIRLRNLVDLDNTDVGYIRIIEFNKKYDANDKLVTNTSAEVTKALEQFKQSGKKTLILDLKGDPGGNVDEVVEIAGNFIYSADKDNNKLLVTTMRERNSSKTYSVKSKYSQYFDVNGGKQIVVYTDKGSASASELLLGAILDYDTGLHLGTTSFGKGIAQYIVPIMSGNYVEGDSTKSSFYAIYYTAAYYYTPSDKNIHKIGFTPSSENTFTNYQDLNLRALTLLK